VKNEMDPLSRSVTLGIALSCALIQRSYSHLRNTTLIIWRPTDWTSARRHWPDDYDIPSSVIRYSEEEGADTFLKRFVPLLHPRVLSP